MHIISKYLVVSNTLKYLQSDRNTGRRVHAGVLKKRFISVHTLHSCMEVYKCIYIWLKGENIWYTTKNRWNQKDIEKLLKALTNVVFVFARYGIAAYFSVFDRFKIPAINPITVKISLSSFNSNLHNHN